MSSSVDNVLLGAVNIILMKYTHMSITQFQNEKNVMNAATEYFDGKRAAYFQNGIFKLFRRWKNRIYLNDDYKEN